MKRVMVSVILAIASAPHLGAQRFAVVQPKADCNIRRVAYDDPLPNVGWHMRRYEWHALYAGLSLASAFILHKAARVGGEKSSVYASVGLGFGPHIRDQVLGIYPIDPLDWAFDATTRSAPIFALGAARSPSILGKVAWVAGYAALYSGLRCFASP